MLEYADIRPKELNVNQFSRIQAYLARVHCEDTYLAMAKIIEPVREISNNVAFWHV